MLRKEYDTAIEKSKDLFEENTKLKEEVKIYQDLQVANMEAQQKLKESRKEIAEYKLKFEELLNEKNKVADNDDNESLFNEKQRNLKSDPKPTRRGHNGKNNFQSNLRIIGVNANGISSKLNSLNHLLKELNPSVLCIQETKQRKMGGIKIESKDYHIFESVRKKIQMEEDLPLLSRNH